MGQGSSDLVLGRFCELVRETVEMIDGEGVDQSLSWSLSESFFASSKVSGLASW